jgi:homoserine kinase
MNEILQVKKEVTVFSPGTIANVGPGFDCLGLALDSFGDTFTVRKSTSGKDTIRVVGRDSALIPLEPEKNCAFIAAAAARKFLCSSKEMHTFLEIEIERSLPMSGGLGASAAASVGGALATSHFFGHSASQKELVDWALEGESAVAGMHLDNIAPCVTGGLALSFFESGKPFLRSYPCSSRLFLTLVTPRMRIETRAAREILPSEVSREIYLQGLARAVGVATAFQNADFELLKASLEDPFAVPLRKALIPNFDKARKVALESGALRLSISGSGPTLFAVSERLDIAQLVSERVSQVYFEMGVSSHVCSVGQKGARVVRVS